MELNEMEKKLLFQVESDYQTKILNELYMTVRYSNNSEQREAAEGLMAKLRVLSNAECMDLVKDIQKNYRLPYPARTIGEKIAEARQQSGAEKLKGHDIMALERFDPEVRHMIVFDVLSYDSPVGDKGDKMRLFLMLGDERTALFLIMSDTDGTFAFLISLIYSILFNRLCERADDVYGGRLPIHVRCLIDEAANIGQIPNLERLMATIRSREISACLVLQAQSQLKALYKDNMDTIIGNCDASLFLGGKEETTLKSWNSLLGKETIDLYNTSVTKGNQESHGQNFQKLGKDMPYLFVKSSVALNLS